MDRIKSYFQGLAFTEKSAPLAFLTACILGFGLLIPTLGFYMDDWPYVFYANAQGAEGLQQMLTYDSRPYAAWLYILGFKILGSNPLPWHLASLFLRWATTVVAWVMLRSIWPNRKIEAICVALLFAVHPFFMLQPSALGSTHHWFGFLVFNLSMFLMIRAVQSSSRPAVLYTILAAGLEALHLFTSEYFSGLELVRLPILWILASRLHLSVPTRVWKTFMQWTPYAFVLLLYAYWRVAVYENPVGIVRNQPVVLELLFSQPLQALSHLASVAIGDSLSVLLAGWQMAMSVDLLSFPGLWGKFRLVITLLACALGYFYLSRLSHGTPNNDDWPEAGLFVGAIGLLVGGLPIWIIGRSIIESTNTLSASRFGLAAMLGAALILFLLIDVLVTEKTRKLGLLAFVLALAVNAHLANAKQFQYSWEKQARLARELLWRAPYLEPDTAIFTDEEILGMMGQYALSFSINTIYQAVEIEDPDYWYFPYYYTYPNIDELLQGTPLEANKMTVNFSGDSKRMILVSFNPELKRCLWILQPQDGELRLVSDDMRRLSAASNIDLIEPETQVGTALYETIFRTQTDQGWCYFFEKADLARQYGDWQEVTRLWDEAVTTGEQADNGFEYIPFIEGFGHLGNWEQVRVLTRSANKITQGLEPSLCNVLDRLSDEAPPHPQKDETITNLRENLKCTAAP